MASRNELSQPARYVASLSIVTVEPLRVEIGLMSTDPLPSDGDKLSSDVDDWKPDSWPTELGLAETVLLEVQWDRGRDW